MSKPWKLKRVKQCAKCPWRRDVDPHLIPNGYSEEKHCALESTIAKPGDLSAVTAKELKIMACHETHDSYCIGWLVNQLETGNNLRLRMSMISCVNGGSIELVGKQHESFEDTLP